MSGQPACWRGAWHRDTTYQQGEIVVSAQSGGVFISRVDNNTNPPPVPEHATGSAWVILGAVGAMPSQVTHAWHGKELQYPLGGQEMSEPAWICEDCWKDGDYKNAFIPRVHIYIIKEPEYG